jgi:hypothetical protein
MSQHASELPPQGAKETIQSLFQQSARLMRRGSAVIRSLTGNPDKGTSRLLSRHNFGSLFQWKSGLDPIASGDSVFLLHYFLW